MLANDQSGVFAPPHLSVFKFICEPIEEDGKPGYRFTATGTFDRLLTGSTLINHGGGGEGS